eukprot:Colp12_sorted_trinity150504_noHs@17555
MGNTASSSKDKTQDSMGSSDRLDAPIKAAHGRNGSPKWPLPKCTRKVAAENRPGYNSVNASEYEDEPEVLQAKIKMLAKMIKDSKQCTAYTGAGISVSAGISDYATQKENEGKEVEGDETPKDSPIYLRPTSAHRTLVALYRAGLLKHWVQQNHDGLPQKAGMPQWDMNEIHGSWFDPTNRIVPMDGMLRGDLVALLSVWAKRADLVLVLGTSLAGMGADRMCHDAAKRAASGNGLGSVIVSVQQTPHDAESSLRIFARLDRVFELLKEEMGLSVDPMDTPLPTEKDDEFLVPYDKDGKLLPEGYTEDQMTRLDLSKGARVRQTIGHFAGSVGKVVGRDRIGNFVIDFMERSKEESANTEDRIPTDIRRCFGAWWPQTLVAGKVDMMPLVNLSQKKWKIAEPVA